MRAGGGHPLPLTGTAQADSLAYDPTTGALSYARSRQGYGYAFQYDLAGQLVRTAFPGGGAERLTYDLEGRRTLRLDSIPGNLLAEDQFQYDARGKMTHVWGDANSTAAHFNNWYSGLGNLVGTDWSNVADAARTAELFVVDAMGNQARRTTWQDGSASPPQFRYFYAPGTGRITRIVKVEPSTPSTSFYADSTYRYYDNAGNVESGVQKQWGPDQNGATILSHYTATRNYYGADEKLRVVQVHDVSTTGTSFSHKGLFSEYRYDALGRRILERTRRDDLCYNPTDGCESTLTRFVWAGDQLLWELRVPGADSLASASLESTSAKGDMYGRVSYFHAGGIDRPQTHGIMNARRPSR